MTDRKLMQLALEALENCGGLTARDARQRVASITALRAALAEPVQEPVTYTTGHCEQHKQNGGCQLHNLQCGWPDCDRKPISTPPKMQPCAGRNCGSTNPNLHSAECFEDYDKATGMAEPVQEAVAWRTFDGEGGYDYRTYEDNEDYAAEWAKRNPRHVGWVEPLYTSPPQRKPLTEEEIVRIFETPELAGARFQTSTLKAIAVARAVEAAHGIKEEK